MRPAPWSWPTRSTTTTDASAPLPGTPRARSSTREARPRIAVVHPYWTLWEHTVGPALRADRLALARRVAASLEDAFETIGVGDFASAGEAAELAPAFTAARAEVVLVLQTMAVPSGFTLALLDALPGVPVVIWALHETGLVAGGFDHGGITTQGATVGAPMLSNILGRRGRPFEMVLGRLTDPPTVARVRRALRLAAVARRISRARLGRVGVPVEGYLHVDVDDDELRAGTGIEVVRIEPDELVERYAAVKSGRVRSLDAEVRATWAFEGDVDTDDSLGRSLRAALAVEDLVSDHRLDAGAFNCHVPQFRFGDPIGIAPCWALGRSTTAGVPLKTPKPFRHITCACKAWLC